MLTEKFSNVFEASTGENESSLWHSIPLEDLLFPLVFVIVGIIALFGFSVLSADDSSLISSALSGYVP